MNLIEKYLGKKKLVKMSAHGVLNYASDIAKYYKNKSNLYKGASLIDGQIQAIRDYSENKNWDLDVDDNDLKTVVDRINWKK